MVHSERETGLLRAFLLDGRGGGEMLDWARMRAWRPEDGTLWVHLDVNAPDVRPWLRNESGLDPGVCDALLAGESRPRCRPVGDGLFLNIRGVNLNPGADPEDMVSIRVWLEPERVVSLRRRKLMAVVDLATSIEEGSGPASSGELLGRLVQRLLRRMEPVIDKLDEKVESLEDAVHAGSTEVESAIAEARREIIVLRRFLSPQRDAMTVLDRNLPEWLTATERGAIHEATDTVTRYVEDLDELRERASVAQDQIANQLTRMVERRTFVFSVLAAIFLPLGLITGLLGINVGGIPGADNPWSFLVVTALLVVLGVLQLWVLRRMGWLR